MTDERSMTTLTVVAGTGSLTAKVVAGKGSSTAAIVAGMGLLLGTE